MKTLIERLSAAHLQDPTSDVGYLLVEAIAAILELRDRLEIRTEYAELYEISDSEAAISVPNEGGNMSETPCGAGVEFSGSNSAGDAPNFAGHESVFAQ